MLPATVPYACHLVDNGTFKGSWVYCWNGKTRHVKLDVTGHFSLTATTPIPLGLGGPGEIVGTRVTSGRFRCEVLPAALECFVIATGKGFLLSKSGVVAVGSTSGATAVPAPVFGKSAAVKTVSGTVLIEPPGASAFLPLSTASSVPLGTTIDTTNGTVELTSAKSAHGGTQTGQFYSGIFKVTQTKARSQLRSGRSVGLTVLSLGGGALSGCAATAGRAFASTSHQVRRLWGDAHGNFRTGGRYASATVRGTKWLTEDTCAGTLVTVARGIVSVEDLRTHKTVLVRAGHSLLAGAGLNSHRGGGRPERLGTKSCGGTLTASRVTSCVFAKAVRSAYQRSGGSSTIRAYSVVTRKNYNMTCVRETLVKCTGGIGASVYFP